MVKFVTLKWLLPVDLLLCVCVFVLAADSIDSSSKQSVNVDGAHIMNGDSHTGTAIALS